MVEQKTAAGLASSVTAAAVLEILGWGAVAIVLGLVGWAVASLDQLAGWTDAATRLAKLTIVKGILASVAASALVVGFGIWQQWPMALMIPAAGVAGMGGDRLLRPVLEALIARLSAAVDALLGGRKNGG